MPQIAADCETASPGDQIMPGRFHGKPPMPNSDERNHSANMNVTANTISRAGPAFQKRKPTFMKPASSSANPPGNATSGNQMKIR